MNISWHDNIIFNWLLSKNDKNENVKQITVKEQRNLAGWGRVQKERQGWTKNELLRSRSRPSGSGLVRLGVTFAAEIYESRDTKGEREKERERERERERCDDLKRLDKAPSWCCCSAFCDIATRISRPVG